MEKQMGSSLTGNWSCWQTVELGRKESNQVTIESRFIARCTTYKEKAATVFVIIYIRSRYLRFFLLKFVPLRGFLPCGDLRLGLDLPINRKKIFFFSWISPLLIQNGEKRIYFDVCSWVCCVGWKIPEWVCRRA